MQGVLGKGEGCVRGVGESLEGQVGVGRTKKMRGFLSEGVRDLDGCYVGHRLERSKARSQGFEE